MLRLGLVGLVKASLVSGQSTTTLLYLCLSRILNSYSRAELRLFAVKVVVDCH